MTSSGQVSSGAPGNSGNAGTRVNSTDLEKINKVQVQLPARWENPHSTESESVDNTKNKSKYPYSQKNGSDSLLENDSVFEKYKEIEKKRMLAAARSRSNVPLRHRDFKLEDVTNELWLSRFKYAKSLIGTGATAAIIGNRGSGKTQMAVEVIRYAYSLGMDAYYITAMDIFISIRECYNSNASQEALIKAYTRYQVLVIDALEEKSDSEWENRMLSHIVNKRYDDMVDTIMISNETSDVFTRQHGSSISDRIRETGGIIECKWLSFRKK